MFPSSLLIYVEAVHNTMLKFFILAKQSFKQLQIVSISSFCPENHKDIARLPEVKSPPMCRCWDTQSGKPDTYQLFSRCISIGATQFP